MSFLHIKNPLKKVRDFIDACPIFAGNLTANGNNSQKIKRPLLDSFLTFYCIIFCGICICRWILLHGAAAQCYPLCHGTRPDVVFKIPQPIHIKNAPPVSGGALFFGIVQVLLHRAAFFGAPVRSLVHGNRAGTSAEQ